MAFYSVIVHVNEIERWPTALTNIRNLLNDAGEPNVNVELLANGPAVLYFANALTNVEGLPPILNILQYRKVAEEMQALYRSGVHFVACANALKMNSIAHSQLLPFVEIVPAGITEIVKKQAEGYAYVKP